MKIGVRKPSLKKSIKARTTGKLKREVKKTVTPGYGKKGVGLIKNPRKAIYNKAYNKTSFSVVPPIAGVSGTSKNTSRQQPRESNNQQNYDSQGIYFEEENDFSREVQPVKKRKTWLWVLGWIFIFPLPLTIILARSKRMSHALKIILISLAWIIFAVIGIAGFMNGGDGESDTVDRSNTSRSKVEDISFSDEVEDEITLRVGDKYSEGYIEVTAKSIWDSPLEDIVFVSDDPAVASFEMTKKLLSTRMNYEIVAVGAGETNVYVTSTDGSVVSPKIRVVVPAPTAVESVTIEGGDKQLVLGESVSLFASVFPENAEDKSVVWRSSDETIVRIDSNGNAIALKGGEVTITAETNNQIQSTISISVDPSKKIMSTKVAHKRQDDVNIGDEWSYTFLINGEPAGNLIIVSVGDKLELYAKISEDDSQPDVGEANLVYTISEDDFENGFTSSMDLYVTENAGPHSGQSAHFVVSFVFSTIR